MPYREEDDTTLKLVPDSFLDNMDDYGDEEIGAKPGGRLRPTQDLDDGNVKILSLDEIKNMKPRKVPSYLKKNRNYNSDAFKTSLHRQNQNINFNHNELDEIR